MNKIFKNKANITNFKKDLILTRELYCYFQNRQRKIEGDYVFFDANEHDERWFESYGILIISIEK